MSAEIKPPRQCSDCKGKGKFLVKETYSDGDEILTSYECGTCEGKGVIYDAENDPAGDFDIEGEDDDE
jgi:DnaJ-class molecular chaperone